MVRMPTGARAIASRLDLAAVDRALLLAVLLAIGLLASAVFARAEGSAAASNQPLAATVAYSLGALSGSNRESTKCQTHGEATVPCGSLACSYGASCQAPAELVASAALIVPTVSHRALPLTEAAGLGSPSTDRFRPPIS